MMLAEQVATFYPDLMDERFESRLRDLSTSAIRPTPSRNGGWRSRSACWPTTARSTPEGQRQLDESHEIRMPRSPSATAAVEDIKPIIRAGASDTARWMRVRGAGASGRIGADDQDHAGARGLVQARPNMPKAWATCTYCNSVMEPWDGPAAWR
jgi:glutamate synthase (NADPH/NADH) large chain/glutamate synthase (ferredoxin)